MKEQRIIIADCDARVRECLLETIEKEHLMKVVATTGSGKELLHLIQQYQPDIVVMDLILPWFDGIGVLQQIKKEPLVFSNPKVFVLTKLNQEEIMQEAFSLGISYYMLKPFKVEFVVERMKQIGKVEYPKNEKLDLENEIMKKISNMGVPHHVKGFRYLEMAILLCIQDMDYLNGITKTLYPSIAKKYNTTTSRVERGIRHAIEIACDRIEENIKMLTDQDEILFLTSNRKPTNSEFIAFVSDKLRMSLK